MKNYIINRFGTRDTTGDVNVEVQEIVRYKQPGVIENGEDAIKRYWLDPRPSQKVHNHSPDGFNFGYGGSGPAQLALAILMDFMGEVPEPALYQSFKFMFVATLPQETGGVIRGEDIQNYLDKWKAEKEGVYNDQG